MSNPIIETRRRIYHPGGFYYEVAPGENPGTTDISYHENVNDPDAPVICLDADYLEALIVQLQARLVEARAEESSDP